MAAASGMTFRTQFEMVNLNHTKWAKATKEAVLKAFKDAAVRYLQIVANSVPLRTGFLWGAFDNLEAWTGKTVVNKGQLFQGVKRELKYSKKLGGLGFHETRRGAYLVNRKTELALQYKVGKIQKYLRQEESIERDLLKRKMAREKKGVQESSPEGQARIVGTQSAEHAAKRREAMQKQLSNYDRQLENIRKRKKILSDKISRYQTGAYRSRYIHTEEQVRIPNPAAQGLTQKQRIEMIKNKQRPPEAFINKTIKKKTKINELDPNNFVDRYREYYYHDGRKTLKTPDNGRSFSTPVDRILTGSIKTKIRFKYDVNISYYRINDMFNMGRGTPWGTYLEIASGFNIYLSRLVAELPRFTNYLYTIKRKLNGPNISTETYAQERGSV